MQRRTSHGMDGRDAGNNWRRAAHCRRSIATSRELLLAMAFALTTSSWMPACRLATAPRTADVASQHPRAENDVHASRASTDVAASALVIRYWVNAVRPREDFSLTIPSTGDCALVSRGPVLPTGSSNEYVGLSITAPIPETTRRAIRQFIDDHDLEHHGGGEFATAEGSGAIDLTRGTTTVRLGLAAPSADATRLREMLDQVIAEMSNHRPSR